uniref:ATP synthase F0 subunit 8 n=1 Tax=Hemisodorcus rubrofemoratus TaxID=617871 RepID=A0AA51YKH3_9SCAR|nr:ATP synthase F0 subunit 8 [Hemisodorcus rubrofemoratus]WMW30211.1 ATP synthase F0 subunit 8 [Hemisodorcus rubrofemoratus]
MPQMAPLNWLPLMLIFSMVLIMISIMNFSIFSQSQKSYYLNKESSSKIWKW